MKPNLELCEYIANTFEKCNIESNYIVILQSIESRDYIYKDIRCNKNGKFPKKYWNNVGKVISIKESSCYSAGFEDFIYSKLVKYKVIGIYKIEEKHSSEIFKIKD